MPAVAISPDQWKAKLEALRKANLETPEQAARRVDVSLRHYKRWMTGKVEPRLSNVERVAKAYKMKPAELLGDIMPKTPPSVTDRLDQMNDRLAALEERLDRLLDLWRDELVPFLAAQDAESARAKSASGRRRPAKAS